MPLIILESAHKDKEDSDMRRVDREMDRDFALMVVDKCEYATIAMTDTDGLPYCLPMVMIDFIIMTIPFIWNWV